MNQQHINSCQGNLLLPPLLLLACLLPLQKEPGAEPVWAQLLQLHANHSNR